MQFLKAAFYTTCGCLLVLFYREGHQVLMNWTLMVWLPFMAWDLVQTLTPYKKSVSRWHD